MRRWIALALVQLGGCAQIFGIEKTTGRDGDVEPVDIGYFDARPCSGGDASMLDETYGHCYLYFTTPKDYMTAKSACDAIPEFHFARIETVNEQPLVATLVGTGLAFIGGNDITAEGTYVWDNGSVILTTYWNMGEPNNGTLVHEEDCIVVDGATGGRWDDLPCDASISTTVPGEYGYVCERD